jgi:RNA ligase
MQLCDYIDLAKLEEQIAQKMVKAQTHPRLPLTILNYTQVAQFTPELWNEVTDRCRGLIYNNETGEIVARGFVKFWNYNDSRHPETIPENFPAEVPEITRKIDGSLGVGFPDNGRLAIATRGSFDSDQARWATAWMKDKPFPWPDGYTPLFEIVYPENRIVVDYKGYEGLVLLALVDNETGEEAPYWRTAQVAADHQIDHVPNFDKSVSDCTAEDDPDQEGYVASWPRPGKHPLRVKIKFETYCRLHKIMTGTSAIGIWELLRDGGCSDSLRDGTPVEFRTWLTSVELDLRRQYNDWNDHAMLLFYRAPRGASRKDFAEYAKLQGRYTPLLFALLDGKRLGPIIWKMIRPKGNIRPFVREEEDDAPDQQA